MSNNNDLSETTSNIEETNRKLMSLYDYRDTIVNQSRSNSMKLYHEQQRATSANNVDLRETMKNTDEPVDTVLKRELLSRIKKMLVDEYCASMINDDETHSSMLVDEFLQFLENRYTGSDINLYFFESSECSWIHEVQSAFFLFHDVLDYYNTILSEQ